MNRKILIALDRSENAMNVVEFAGEIVGSLSDVEVILLYVAKPIVGRRAGDVSEEEWKDLKDLGEKWQQQVVEEMDNVVNRAKEVLIKSGMAPNRIQVKLIPLEKDVALDILSEAKKQNCSIIAVGRKGHSALAEVLLGSVSKRIVHHAHEYTVWVVQ